MNCGGAAYACANTNSDTHTHAHAHSPYIPIAKVDDIGGGGTQSKQI